MNQFTFDISLVQFEERHVNLERGTTTLYFIAPKEWLGNQYPEAIHSEISVEFPIIAPNSRLASTSMSPTRLTEDGGSEDYDWFDIDLGFEMVEALMQLAYGGKK